MNKTETKPKLKSNKANIIALAAAAAVRTLQTGILPPTVNYETPDPACPLAGLSNHAAELDARGVLVGSLGFGGHNAVLCFRRFDG